MEDPLSSVVLPRFETNSFCEGPELQAELRLLQCYWAIVFLDSRTDASPAGFSLLDFPSTLQSTALAEGASSESEGTMLSSIRVWAPVLVFIPPSSFVPI